MNTATVKFDAFESLKNDKLDISKYWITAQQKLNLDNSVKFLKTHNACISLKDNWFTDENNTIGYIYLVRDPRSVVCSYAAYAGISIEKTVDILINRNFYISNEDEEIVDVWSSWKINYLSWKKEKKYKGIIIKYEDLLENPFSQFSKILNFLKDYINIKIDKKKIKDCINSCEFKNLKELEKKFGFGESMKKNKFFRKAEIVEWKKVLNGTLRKKIEDTFKNEMKDLEYL